MRIIALYTMAIAGALMMTQSTPSYSRSFRPPAMPLVTTDPYFSVWSMGDELTSDFPRHWTGATAGMCGMVRIDGKAYRFIGPSPEMVPAAEQVSADITPTRSIYEFKTGGVGLTVTFTTPLLLDDLNIMSRPASYIDFGAKSIDGADHKVAIYVDVTGEWVTNVPSQEVVWGRLKLGEPEPLQLLKIGTREQPILAKSGDNLRIDWGHLYVVAKDEAGSTGAIASDSVCRTSFAETGSLPTSDDLNMPRPASDDWPVLACAIDMGQVGARIKSNFVTLAYDDEFSIEYLHRKLRPYWRKDMTLEQMLRAAVSEHSALIKRCEKFDAQLEADAAKAGGPDYVDIVSAAYRQAIAAHKLAVDIDGNPMLFSKENFSNGCIATVDVTYPSCPIFLLYNPELLKAMIEPVMRYGASRLWRFDFAPHDLGTYPLANGQVYGGGARTEENQMPVEESGNMIIMLAALSRREGNAAYAGKYWDTISKWATYLKDKGLDPENQLCTDDFAGHLAHNANLSIKAITGLACYADMADMLGKKDVAKQYRTVAEEMAVKWQGMANDGDHYKLAFDKSGTWSMKYNLVWDKLLGLHLFDPAIAKTEIKYYKQKSNIYGLPLDSRKDYTKGDWLVWTAALSQNKADFEALIAPLRKYLNESSTRIPFSDWHSTTDGKSVGFRARSVVGGVFIGLLNEQQLKGTTAKQ